MDAYGPEDGPRGGPERKSDGGSAGAGPARRAGRWGRGVRAAAVTVAVAGLAAAGLAGCSDGSVDGGGAASAAASAAASVGAQLSAAASEAGEVFSSATAAAKEKLDGITGDEVKGSVTLGTPATNADGRTTVEVTVANSTGEEKSFAVQVLFKDPTGKDVDTVVLTVDDVPANGTGKGTARSTHELPDGVTAEVATALRY
ncbi:hypothetical protein [Streptomyces sp. NPDC097619]|uniref:hypothetical protein n=1 Tax=Streptomyces sp. NPDC097619 TaxID=3157228 RepID=UPI0033182432